MCGIAGLLTALSPSEVDSRLRAMVGSIAYRGPDDTGYYTDGPVGLGHARLAVIDPAGGRQPAFSEDGSIAVIFNGEIFNFHRLRTELRKLGHAFGSHSDTDILPHLYEEFGDGMFEKLNGQFAIAVWDKRRKKLVLGRDRFGEKPLFYYRGSGGFCFASEAKAIFKSGLVSAELSPDALRHIFTFWTTVGDETVFRGVRQLLPGTCLILEEDRLLLKPYWRMSFVPDSLGCADEAALTEELERRLVESVKNRLVADVPVSFYLSGGLDSSLIACIAERQCGAGLNTFSLTFDDPAYDESAYQTSLAGVLRSNHRSVTFRRDQIPSLLREVVWHTETPFLRTGVCAMYALAGLVRCEGLKVVLSGEGSDELFGGYDIFREVKIRRFIARDPQSALRPMLYKKINSFVPRLNDQSLSGLSYFYGGAAPDSLFESHLGRWKLGDYSRQFFTPDFAWRAGPEDALDAVRSRLPEDFPAWTPVRRAQYLELITLFENYLLSSQGDRVSMGQGVECRLPFLDNAVAAFAAALPDTMKIRGLNEKYIVKRLARKYVPEPILRRQKFPFRAPVDIAALMGDASVREALGEESLRKAGIFSPAAVERFLTASLHREKPNERDAMLLMGLLTTQLLAELFLGA